MEKIIQINYQGRNISIEESAYEAFQQYESELKSYFLKEEGGEETFADLQYRMSEILEQRNVRSLAPITMSDIEELIQTIGKPSDLGDMPNQEEEKTSSTPIPEKKKLYRNKNKSEKMIGGVCSGIADYFSIDPIAVRLAFVLFTIFNIATLFSFPLGIAAYVLLWIVLEPVYIKSNIHRKLFRNPKDKVLAGVCSGIAQFFSIETWIVRLAFLAPIGLGIITHRSHFGGFGVHAINASFFSLSFISYILLWIIVPIAKSSTDYMLLKGEPINISTIQNSKSMNFVTEHSNSGLNKFLKVIAYITLASFLLFMLPIASGLLIGLFFSYNMADIILYSGFNKTLGLISACLFLALPIAAVLLWLIRRIGGFKSNSKAIRSVFMILFGIGIISTMMLIFNLAQDNNTYVSKIEKQYIQTTSDTLFIEPMNADSTFTENVVFEMNSVDRILERTSTTNNIKGVRLKYKSTKDTSFYVEIEKSSLGKNRGIAGENAKNVVYPIRVEGNKLYLSSMLSVLNSSPYHGQNVKVTVYIPAGKTAIASENLKRQLSRHIRISHKNFEYRTESNSDDDEIIKFSDDDVDVITIDDSKVEVTTESNESKREAKQILEDAQREAQLKIDEAKREAEASQREAQLKIEEAKRDLEESTREAERKIREANQSSSNKK